jgi:hypothetical protein
MSPPACKRARPGLFNQWCLSNCEALHRNSVTTTLISKCLSTVRIHMVCADKQRVVSIVTCDQDHVNSDCTGLDLYLRVLQSCVWSVSFLSSPGMLPALLLLGLSRLACFPASSQLCLLCVLRPVTASQLNE